MKNLLPLALMLTAACSAQVTVSEPGTVNSATRAGADEISSRIRQQFESRGIRFEDVFGSPRKENPGAPSAQFAVAPHREATTLSAADKKTLERIVNVFDNIYKVYSSWRVLTWSPTLYYSTTGAINAYAAQGDEVVVYLGLAELLGDSDDQLAFVIAHLLGHIVQQREGLHLVYDNAELDADQWSVMALFDAGYDPYAAFGSLGKLAMATGYNGLAQTFDRQSAADAHTSMLIRIETMYDRLRAMCEVNAQTRNLCSQHRSAGHPHFPPDAVL